MLSALRQWRQCDWIDDQEQNLLLSASIDAESGVSSRATANCFSVSLGKDLYVGAATTLPVCVIGSAPGCSFNPTITLISSSTPLPALGEPAVPWLMFVLLVTGLGLAYGLRRGPAPTGERTGV